MKHVNYYTSAGLNALLRKSLYNPMELPKHPSSYDKLSDAELDIIELETADGVSPIAWHRKAEPGKHTFVYFHGNTDHMGVYYRVDKYAEIIASGHGLLALGYRGFDIEHEGSITEEGLYHDARAALQFLLGECNIPLQHIILFGESLGSGVATHMATEHPGLGGIILDCPYPSIPHEIKHRHPYIPDFLIGYVEDRFDSISKVPSIDSPILIIHASTDTVIPVSHGKKLHDAAKHPKHFIEVEDAVHVEYPLDVFQEIVRTFTREHALPVDDGKITTKTQNKAPQKTTPIQKKTISFVAQYNQQPPSQFKARL